MKVKVFIDLASSLQKEIAGLSLAINKLDIVNDSLARQLINKQLEEKREQRRRLLEVDLAFTNAKTWEEQDEYDRNNHLVAELLRHYNKERKETNAID